MNAVFKKINVCVYTVIILMENKFARNVKIIVKSVMGNFYDKYYNNIDYFII